MSMSPSGARGIAPEVTAAMTVPRETPRLRAYARIPRATLQVGPLACRGLEPADARLGRIEFAAQQAGAGQIAAGDRRTAD